MKTSDITPGRCYLGHGPMRIGFDWSTKDPQAFKWSVRRVLRLLPAGQIFDGKADPCRVLFQTWYFPWIRDRQAEQEEETERGVFKQVFTLAPYPKSTNGMIALSAFAGWAREQVELKFGTYPLQLAAAFVPSWAPEGTPQEIWNPWTMDPEQVELRERFSTPPSQEELDHITRALGLEPKAC